VNETQVTALALQGDDNVLVGGNFLNVGVASCPTVTVNPYITTGLHPNFVRLLTAGTGTGLLDTTFNANINFALDQILTMNTGSTTNQIVIGGGFDKVNCTSYCGMASAPTTTFDYINGDLSNPVPACIDNYNGGAIVDYGGCMTNGSTAANYVARFRASDGLNDGTFHSTIDYYQSGVAGIALQSDNSVIVGGTISSVYGNQVGNIFRLDQYGNFDQTFNPGANNMVNAVLVQPGGNIITGGSFTSFTDLNTDVTTIRNNIAQLDPTGALVSTFNPNADGQVNVIAPLSSTQTTTYYIAGDFLHVGATPRSHIARIWDDGKKETQTTLTPQVYTYGSGTNTVSVTVVAVDGSGTPTGQVVLSIDSVPTSTLSLNSGSALFSTPTTSAGTHTLTANYLGTSTGNPTYEASMATGTLTVMPATLLVTANSTSRPYLIPNPTFTVSYTGFVYGQTASVVTGTAVLSTTAVSSSPTGTYAITLSSCGTLTAVNYGFNCSNGNGVLTITAATPTVTVSSNSTPTTYGNPVTFTATLPATATGTVTFKDGGNTIGAPVSLSGGSPSTATYSTSPSLLTAGTHTITAVYSGDTNFGALTSSNFIQTISKATPTTSIVSNATSTAYGNPVTFTATVTTGATGTVAFKEGSTTYGIVNLSNGSPNIATFTTSTLPVSGSPHQIMAYYNGDTNFATSSSSNVSLTVTSAATTVAVSSNSTSTTYGNPVTFTATVQGATSATGTMTFNDNGIQIGTGTVLSGIATFTTSTPLLVGSHPITASYGGDTNYASSTLSPVFTQTINQAASSTNITSTSPNPSVYGSPVILKATVAGAGATGSVIFTEGSTTLGTGVLTSGTATYTTSALNVAGSPHLITAVYSGDSNYLTSTSSPYSQAISKATTTTSVLSSSPSSTYGNSLTFTATVTTSATGTTTGTVTFNSDGTFIGTGSMAGGIATFTTSTVGAAVSPHSITAVYNGDSNFQTSTSNAYPQTINKASTSAVVVSNNNSPTFGTSVSFTATVTGAGSTPTGLVTFWDGGNSMGLGVALSNGSATYSTSLLSGGTHTITAVYGGDTNFTTSTSPAIPQTVNKASTSTGVSPSTASTTYGSSVTFTATVTSGATGTVMFNDSVLGTIGTGALSGGTATFSTTTLGVAGSPHTITASYGGDTNYSGSTSSGVIVSIARASTVTGVNSDILISAKNTDVTFTALVASTGGNPTGTVQFHDNQTGDIGLPANISGGMATLIYQFATIGTHTITATYNGDANFLVSTSSSHPISVVNSTSTTNITLTNGTNPSTYGTLLTFSSTVTSSGGIPSGSVTFTDNGSTILGTSTLSSGVATLSTSSLGGGSHSITATYGGDLNFGQSISSPALSQTVNKANQSITFNALAAKTFGNGDFTLGASTNSSLTVTYASSNPSVATITGSTVHIVSSGTTTITASQDGDGNYNAAAPVQQLLTVNKATLTVTADDKSKAFNAVNPTLTWTYSGYVNGDTAAVLSGYPLLTTTATTASAPGSYPITAAIGTLSAANYTFSFVSGTLTVGLMPQSITFSPLTAVTYGNGDFSLGAAASSTLPVSYASSNPSVATITGSTVHIVSSGTTTITASQDGDVNYNAAAPVQQPLTVNPATLIVTAVNASRAYSAANPAFTCTYSGYVNGDTAAVLSGYPLLTTTATTASAPGSYPIAAAVGTLSAANYTFSFVSGTLTVGLMPQSLTFGTLAIKAYGDADFAPATASSGLPVSYVSSNTSVATIVGSNIHIAGAGTTMITASQPGDNITYSAATNVQQSLTVVMADGKFNGTTGPVDVTDALKSLRIAAGIDTPTQDDLLHGDVAPLANGKRQPDGKIDISDVVAILRKAAGLPSW
jgi:hypothetical protein